LGNENNGKIDLYGILYLQKLKNIQRNVFMKLK